jgi:hypothetical protein
MGIRCALRHHAQRLSAALCALPTIFSVGCAQAPQGATPPAAASETRRGDTQPGGLYSLFHRSLKAPPPGAVEVLRLYGQGTQIFRCESQAAGLRWVYRLPDAELRDAAGNLMVRHGVNMSFEHVDGSRLFGEIVDHVPSPNENSLPWLLLTTREYGKGALTGITYVERIDTVGGMPPASCNPGELNLVLRVPFSADFVFFR